MLPQISSSATFKHTHTQKQTYESNGSFDTDYRNTEQKQRNPRKLCPNITGYVLTLEGREEQ